MGSVKFLRILIYVTLSFRELIFKFLVNPLVHCFELTIRKD